MFLFTTLCCSKIYESGSYIKETLTKGQTFIIETGETDWNNTIVIPNIKGLTVNFVQGSNSLGKALGGSEMNGIVGYEKQPVKAVIQAKEDVTLEAYVSGTQDSQYIASHAIIFTDPSFKVKIANPDESYNIKGFFPEHVRVVVETKSRISGGWWFSASTTYQSNDEQFPSYFLAGQSNQTVTITVSPLSDSIKSPALFAVVDGKEKGATFKLSTNEKIKTYTANYKSSSPRIPTRAKTYTRTISVKPSKKNDEFNYNKFDSYYSEDPIFMGIFVIIMIIFACVLVYIIVKICKKIRNEIAENDAIPPVAGPLDQITEPLSSPYDGEVAAPAPKAQRNHQSAQGPQVVYVYPQVNASYPQV